MGLDLAAAELLDRVVEIICTATDADGSFLHLWDEARETLVLSAATEGIERGFLHQVELRIGQGLSGLAAMKRRPVVVNLDPHDDPHFQHFPGLGDDQYRSTAKFPILRSGGDLLAVLSVNSRRPRAFDDHHLAIAKELADLLPSILASTERGDAVAWRARVIRHLGELTAALCSSRTTYEVLGILANTAASALTADLCIVALEDPDDSRLTMKAIAPFRSDVLDRVAAVAGEDVDRHTRSSGLQRMLTSELAVQFGSMASAPIATGNESLGLVNCYRAHRFSPDEHDLLAIIARQFALATTDASERWDDREPTANLVFRRIEEGLIDDQTASMAAALGVNLARTHVVVCCRFAGMDPATAPDSVDIARAGRLITSLVSAYYPGSLVSMELDSVAALVEVGQDDGDRRLQRRLLTVVQDAESRHRVIIRGGISQPTDDPSTLTHALRSASEALDVTMRIDGDPIALYTDIAPKAHLYRVAFDPAFDHDPVVKQLLILLDHDQQKGSELLHTLDVYLGCRGNGSRTANELGIHRNTLRQRLERVALLTDLDLDAIDDWLPLQLAVRVVALRTEGKSAT